jgi:hypothetical protein
LGGGAAGLAFFVPVSGTLVAIFLSPSMLASTTTRVVWTAFTVPVILFWAAGL